MKSFVNKLLAAFIYIMLYIPILVLIVYSFNNAKYSLQWQGFSLKWYQELIHDSSLWIAFFNSMLLGFCAATLATIIGLFACVYFFLNVKSRHRPIIFTLLLLLVIIPELVLGIALLLFFNVSTIPLGFTSLLIAHITFCIPFVVLTINVRIQTLDPNIYFCALDLGANRFHALRRILMPLLWPAVLSGFLLSFTLSLDDVIVSYFVAGPEFNILSLTIYSLVRAGITPELNALCSFTFGLSMALVILAHRLARKSS